MSTLLEQASLVLIPSGYAEDKVYSVIPSNGSGDMSFTRASDGTRINSDGLVENTPWNILRYSEQFNNGVWVLFASGTGVNPIVTANTTIAPNETLTADTIVLNAGAGTTASDQSQIYQTFSNVIGNIYTVSFYAKGIVGGEQLMIRHARGSTYTKITLTNQWERYSVTETSTYTGTGFLEILIRRGQNEPINASATFFIWGAQLNIGSTAKPYFPTTDRLNVPRLTYQNGGGGCPSLLLEPQRTNLLTYSQQIQNAAWNVIGGDLVVTGNAVISPDGTQNAGAITLANSASRYFVHNLFSITGGVAYTYSVYMKSASGTLQINMGGVNGLAGVLKTVTTEWQRFTYTFTPATTYSEYFGFDNRGAGSSTSGTLYFWGAQVEASSYATSYIPTVASSATRIADRCLSIGTPLLLNDFSVFMSIKLSQVNQGLGYMLFGSVNSASISRIYSDSGANLSFTTLTTTTGIGVSGLSINTDYKICFTRSGTTLKYFRNGALINTFTVQSEQFNFTSFCNGVDGGGDTAKYNTLGVFSQGIVFPNALTNAEAITLTTI